MRAALKRHSLPAIVFTAAIAGGAISDQPGWEIYAAGWTGYVVGWALHRGNYEDGSLWERWELYQVSQARRFIFNTCRIADYLNPAARRRKKALVFARGITASLGGAISIYPDREEANQRRIVRLSVAAARLGLMTLWQIPVSAGQWPQFIALTSTSTPHSAWISVEPDKLEAVAKVDRE